MNSPAAIGTSTKPSAAAGFEDLLRGAVKHVTWRAAGTTLAIAIALQLWSIISAYQVAFFAVNRRGQTADFYVSEFIVNLVMAFCILFATLVADEWAARGAKRLPAYASAVVIGSAIGAVVLLGIEQWLPLTSHNNTPAYALFEYLIWGGIIVFIYVNRRSALLASTRMNAAQVHLALAQRSTLESRLQALQARVEPQFLFSTLARVRELYESDPARGSRVLSDLIVYLRAALPHLRQSTSTLGQEIDLAQAYVSIMRADADEHLDLHVDVTGTARAANMPSMLLLPLIELVLTRRLAAGTGQGAIGVSARTEAEKLRVEIADSGQAFAPEGQGADLEVIRDRLHALYGDDGALTFETSGSRGTRVLLEIPLGGTDGHRR